MIQIWGRRNSVNVQKILWCCDELALPFERIDAGMAFGRNKDPEYLSKNPNGMIPLIVDGDFHLWESNSIMRYLVMQYDGIALYPTEPRVRAGIDRWLDWLLSTLQPVESPVFWGLVRTPEDQRDYAVLQEKANVAASKWAMLDRHLETNDMLEGGAFSIADLALGAYARRWFGVEGVTKPDLPNLERWFGKLSGRAGFKTHIAPPLT